MAYTNRYRIKHLRYSNDASLNNAFTTIDILDASYSGGITNLRAATDPLNISFGGDVDNIYAPSFGSSAVISVLTTPYSLEDMLTTTDPQKYMVKIYDGSSGVNLMWQGFVNTNIYDEAYGLPTTYPNSQITINCNDGMNVLDSMYYRQVDSSLYTGTQTISAVMTTILGKLNTKYNYIHSNSDLTTDGTNHNLFTQLKVKNENYFDESLVSMSCREVLDSMLGGLGLVMSFKGLEIYIIDPINLNTASNGRVYDVSTFTENSSTFGGYLDISNRDINWKQIGARRDVVNRKDEIHINYDPYTIIEYSYDFGSDKNWSTVGTFYNITTPSPNNYYRNNTVVFKDWTQTTTGTGSSHFRGLKETSTGDPTFALYIDASADILTYTIPYSNISADDTLSMSINLQSYCQTVLTSVYNNIVGDNIYATTTKTPVYAYYIQFSINVGDQYWKDDHWETGETGNYHQLLAVRDWTISDGVYVADHTKSQVGDSWCPIKPKLIPLSASMTGGTIEFKIYNILVGSMITYDTSQPGFVAGALYRKLLLKDFKLEFVNTISAQVISNTGVLKTGKILNTQYKNNKTEIKTTNGTGTYGVSRGAFMNVDDEMISRLYRTSYHTTEDLLLQNLVSEYKEPRFVINGRFDTKNTKLNTNLKLIKDSNFQGTRAYYIVNGTYNDRFENMDVQMVEIVGTKDDL